MSTAVKPISFLRDRDARIFTAFTLSTSIYRQVDISLSERKLDLR
jgi:hypothetical protein